MLTLFQALLWADSGAPIPVRPWRPGQGEQKNSIIRGSDAVDGFKDVFVLDGNVQAKGGACLP